MRRNKIKMTICVLMSIMIPLNAFAEIYVREHTYNASPLDTKETSKVLALDHIKIILLHEIGTYIYEEINIKKNNQGDVYLSRNIESVTANFLNTTIIQEKWIGGEFYLKVEFEIDNTNVINALTDYKTSSNKKAAQELKLLNSYVKTLSRSRKNIQRLKKELANSKLETEKKQIQEKYLLEVKQLYMADMFAKGTRLEKSGDLVGAAKLYREVAEGGNAVAQLLMGIFYKEGKGVTQDTALSMYWLEKSAYQNEALAQFYLGFSYQKFKGNSKKAAFWFKKSAEQGDSLAQLNLAGMYIGGVGMPRNNGKAAYWIRKSAESGIIQAQYNLGMMYKLGLGLESNSERSQYWFHKAAEQGDEQAARMIRE